MSGAGSIDNHYTSNIESSSALKTANSGMMCLWRERRKVRDAIWGGEFRLLATAQCCSPFACPHKGVLNEIQVFRSGENVWRGPMDCDTV